MGGGNRQGEFAPGPGIRGPLPQCERGCPKYCKFGREQSYGISILEEVEEKVCGKCDEQVFFSRDVVLGEGGGGKLLLWGEKNVKNIQKTNENCYCLGGEGGGEFKT